MPGTGNFLGIKLPSEKQGNEGRLVNDCSGNSNQNVRGSLLGDGPGSLWNSDLLMWVSLAILASSILEAFGVWEALAKALFF